MNHRKETFDKYIQYPISLRLKHFKAMGKRFVYAMCDLVITSPQKKVSKLRLISKPSNWEIKAKRITGKA